MSASMSIVSSRMSMSASALSPPPLPPDGSASEMSLSSQLLTMSSLRSATCSSAASLSASWRFTLPSWAVLACDMSFSSRTFTSSSSDRARFDRVSTIKVSSPSVSSLMAAVTRFSSLAMSSSAAFTFSIAFSASAIGRMVSRERSYSSWLLSLSLCVLNCMRCSASSCACRSCVSSYSRMDDTPTARLNSSKMRSMISLMRLASFWIWMSRSCSLLWKMATSGMALSLAATMVLRSSFSFVAFSLQLVISVVVSFRRVSSSVITCLVCSASTWRSLELPSSAISSTNFCRVVLRDSSACRSKAAAFASMLPVMPPVMMPDLLMRVPSSDTILCRSPPVKHSFLASLCVSHTSVGPKAYSNARSMDSSNWITSSTSLALPPSCRSRSSRGFTRMVDIGMNVMICRRCSLRYWMQSLPVLSSSTTMASMLRPKATVTARLCFLCVTLIRSTRRPRTCPIQGTLREHPGNIQGTFNRCRRNGVHVVAAHQKMS
mmetsp:Transcript_7094/g.12280  ORF Transcript_7094/g.12280 Transcript_7094/m.12280 type:complete len:491 (-) Transcript_7094:273-1745(-)